MKKAKIFICHHPIVLVFYDNLAEIIRKYDKGSKIILFKINHEYFSDFDFASYSRRYDEIVEFDFVEYKKNFLVGFWNIFKFQRKLKKTINSSLKDFEIIDIILAESAWLPVNIMLYNLSKQKNIKNISRISFADPGNQQTKIDRLKSFLCFLYTLFFKCYKINVITTLGGRFLNFAYAEDIPGTLMKTINPTSPLIGKIDLVKNNLFPYPVIPRSSSEKKDMVIIFGDTGIFKVYSEYLPDYQTFVEKITIFFDVLAKKYSHYKLYYKPHPSDGNKIMPGINLKKYNLFDAKIDAPILFNNFNQRIKAVYGFSSFSIIFGSFFGVPSYFFYHYLYNKDGVERFENLYNQETLRSKFIFYIKNIRQIGAIDNLKRPKPSDFAEIDVIYRKILNV